MARYITAQERDERVAEAWYQYDTGEISAEEREAEILHAWIGSGYTEAESREIIKCLRSMD